MRSVLCAGSAFLLFSACGHHHPVYYEMPPSAYRHYHRLSCDHRVECRYYGGHHHYRPHDNHHRYWHVHRTPSGEYKRCYVVQKKHDHEQK